MSLQAVFADGSVCIRMENAGSIEERAAVWAINEAAFARADEADLVDKLRGDGHAILSLVAELNSSIIGHILFSRMWIDTAAGLVSAAALAPMAVSPTHQRKGIGGLLLSRGLGTLREQGEKIVIVVGHPDYYPKFGFSIDKAAGLESPFPREAFMAIELSCGALDGIRGAVVYPSPFGI
jgi:putative acetyltransferase